MSSNPTRGGDLMRVLAGSALTCALALLAAAPASGQSRDLAVTAISLNPSTPVQGQPVEVRVTVTNLGQGPAPVELSWYPGESYTQAGCSWPGGTLAAGAKREFTCMYAGYPSDYAQINTKAVVDPYNQVTESNEANNTRLLPISVARPPLPDLTIAAITVSPEPPVQGKAMAVAVRVANQGKGPAAGPFGLTWFPGESYPQPACTWSIQGTLAPGATKDVTCTYTGYPSWYARINMKVVVDPTNGVQEANENNNTKLMSISVQKPQ